MIYINFLFRKKEVNIVLKKLLCAAFLMTISLNANDYSPYYPASDPYQNYSGSPDRVENYYVQGADVYPPPTPGCTTSTYPYEAYPGLAYESSISTLKIVTTVVVGVALIALIVVVFKNTPCNNGHCH
ncbi:MAG: hypothetical protein H0W50_00685 [Parachlamydiaceae bacterium]|nr:hypothetical protein [Parachlamydiaceae bacterium]